MTPRELKKYHVDKDAITAFKSGHLGHAGLENAISHALLTVLQARQHGNNMYTIPVEFDICELRRATFKLITGHDQ